MRIINYEYLDNETISVTIENDDGDVFEGIINKNS